MVEYAFLLLLILVVAVGVVRLIGESVSGHISDANSGFTQG